MENILLVSQIRKNSKNGHNLAITEKTYISLNRFYFILFSCLINSEIATSIGTFTKPLF
jgi:hypothetical protein